MRLIAALLLVLALGLAGCQLQTARSSAPPPLPPGVGATAFPDDAILSARALYIAKCARCHNFHNPANYADDEWNGWVTKMSRKAKLKPDQEMILRDYLGLFRVNPKPEEMQSR
jgi:hypothetical protein